MRLGEADERLEKTNGGSCRGPIVGAPLALVVPRDNFLRISFRNTHTQSKTHPRTRMVMGYLTYECARDRLQVASLTKRPDLATIDLVDGEV